MLIRKLAGSLFEVRSESDKEKRYTVNITERSCTCPAYKYKGFCKHIAAVDEFILESDG